MNTPSPRPLRSLLQTGFTLLEVMVVVLIVGIIVSMATLNVFQSADRQLAEEARRIAALAQLATEESIINNTSYVLALSKTGYQFFMLDEVGRIIPLPETEKAYRARELPDWALMQAKIAGEDAPLPTEIKLTKYRKPAESGLGAVSGLSGDDAAPAEAVEMTVLSEEVPRIVFMSSGEVTPFLITLKTDEGITQQVRGDYSGTVKYLGRVDE